MITLASLLSDMKSAPASESWHVRDLQHYTLLYYFTKSDQDVKILPTEISTHTQQLIAKQLHEENLRLGAPVKLTKAVEDMTFYDWLEVHHELLKFKILHTGKRRSNPARLLPTCTEKNMPFRLQALLSDRVFPIAVGSMAAMAVILATTFHSLSYGLKMSPLHSYMFSIIGALVWFNIFGSFVYDLGTKRLAKQLKNNVSATWEEVLACHKPEDALLLDMVSPVLLQCDIALRDIPPAEALDLCLRLSADSDKHLTDLQDMLTAQWSTSIEPTATSIPVPVVNVALQQELQTLTSSFRSDIPKSQAR